MKLLKRAIILLTLTIAGWFAYANYHQIDLFDYEKVIQKIAIDVSSLLSEEEEQELVEPQITEEQPSVNKPISEEKAKRGSEIKAPPNPFSVIDNHARNTPDSVEVDIRTLANYLSIKSHTDLEKARAIYIWLTDNIAYDDNGFNSGNYSSTKAEDVLANRISVCDGYGSLYLALGEELGLDIDKVIGYAKGYGHTNGQRFTDTDHAWNAIKINGNWRIFDATWGRGNGKNVKGKLVSTKAYKDSWFNVDPYESIFSHYPENAAYSFVSPPISLEEYEKMPTVNQGYFDLIDSGDKVYNIVLNKENFTFPQFYPPSIYIKAVKIPLEGRIINGQTYEFEIHVPKGSEVALIDAKKNWTYFENNGGRFTLSYKAHTDGTLKVGVRKKGGKPYDILLEYEVVPKNELI